MTSIKHTLLAFILVSLLVPFPATAQNNTSSPYSYFGFGDLSNVAYGRNLALGGTGYALRGGNYINLKNPASLSSIDSLSTLYETGVFGKLTQNTAADQSEKFWDGNITHLTLAHRYTTWLMGNYGLMPYSDVGYNFRTIKSVQGDNSSIVTDWRGSGGISRLFYSLGLKLSDHFSLGAEAAFYYGPINQNRKTTLLVEQDNNSYYNSISNYSGFSYKGAFQYYKPIGEKGSGIILGGMFSPEYRFTGSSIVTISQGYGSSVLTVSEEESDAENIDIPMTYGAGASYVWRGKYMLTADYDFSQWSSNNNSGYTDRQVFSAGFEVLPQQSLKYFERCSYRVGFNYDSGFISIKDYNVDDIRLSLGVGLPLQKSRSSINLSLEAGQRGTSKMGLIRERYAKFTVAFSFHDFWFVQRKID